MSSNPQDVFQWVSPKERYPGAPPYLVGLPRGEGFNGFKILWFDFTALKSALILIITQLLHVLAYLSRTKVELKGVADLGLGVVLAPTDNWEKVTDLFQFFKWPFLPKPLIAELWQEDVEFGRQFLQGLNPVLMRKCKEEDIGVGSKFPVTEDHLKSYLGDNFSLKSALDKGKLYIVDYEIFDNIIDETQEDQLGRYSASPLCLFYLNDQDQLLPVAIKVKQNYNSGIDPYPEIFTPKSSKTEWKAAKLAVSATDIAYQGIIAHLLDTHLVIEVCAVSTYRTLPSDHILYQLLKPHFFNTFAINYMARSTFLGRGGFFDSTGALGYTSSNELLSRAYWGEGLVTSYKGEPWEFYKKALPYSLNFRDVQDLPNYYYKDDALLIWNATKKYVNDVIKNHYPDNQAVENDGKLQAWKNELISPDAGTIKGLLPPEKASQLTGKLNNIDDLIEIVTTMIFLATTQHAAVNFGQYDYGAWVANMPFALYEPFSSLYTVESEEEREKILLKWLPGRKQTIKQIVLVKVLTILPPITSKSLLTLDNPFQHESDQQVFKNFKQRLKEIESQLKERNQKLKKEGKTPYVYLQPSRIPQSIAI
ncbi:putative lipoxygenase [Crocosphaera subtropica ATCC 51142]|uniref:Lipoxygenase n=1 Tax=Crocosphaera subtropica (strain ATCC 51142 / BH68) TaxID=43989 RepID=B1WVQ1_CROS5|nr:lipoxygenase family protein [Crocosphaera subtropica]ACB50638.1 putative lipoxygenase [Crocosphaera subtropica ATCC 51142]